MLLILNRILVAHFPLSIKSELFSAGKKRKEKEKGRKEEKQRKGK